MEIQIIVDAQKALQQLATDERQIPYALSRAVNSTALDVQRAIRNRQRSIFTQRRPEWADRSVKITHFATKTAPWAIIGIHPPGAQGEQRTDIIGKFETDTVKRAREGRTVAIPVDASLGRKGTTIIPHRNRPSALNFHKVGNRVIGDRGTFIIRKPDGSGLILQRTGRGRGRKGSAPLKGSTRVLYILALRARIKPNLHFIATAQVVVDTRFSQHMVREFDAAMRTAK